MTRNINDDLAASVRSTIAQKKADAIDKYLALRRTNLNEYMEYVATLGLIACDFEHKAGAIGDKVSEILCALAQIAIVDIMNAIDDRLAEEAEAGS